MRPQGDGRRLTVEPLEGRLLMSTVSVGDVTLAEGNAGTQQALVAVRLSAPSARPVTVNYATADGSATAAGGDYQAVSGKLTFAAGETVKTIAVPVAGDLLAEPDETFSVRVSGAKHAKIADGTGVVTITDDDKQPYLVIDDVSRAEGQSGETLYAFTVSLSAASDATVTVAYATADASATVADNDYEAASGTLAFAPGETSKTITVVVYGDVAGEGGERFYVNLSGAANAFIADSQGFGWIADDDNYSEPDYWDGGCTMNCGTSGDAYDFNNHGVAP